MNRTSTKSIIGRAISFLSTLTLSLAIINSLPSYREKRQKSFDQAVIGGNFYRLQLMSLTGVNVNARGKSGLPLSIAAAQGRTDIVGHLLNHGADVNARDELGHTALSEATFNGRIAVIEQLLRNGADINAIANDGTALDIAKGANNASAIALLRHYGAKTTRELR